MSETMFLGYQNLGDYLSLSRGWFPRSFFKQRLLQFLKKSDEKIESRSRLLTLHGDIIEMIVRRLHLIDRKSLGLAIKSWNSVCLRGGAQEQEVPWLVLPQDPNCNRYLCFFSLSEGKVHKLRLPKTLQGCWFYGSSRGWLIMLRENRMKSEMFLFNPISGVQCRLPPLATIPSFQQFVEEEWDSSLSDLPGTLFPQIVLSASDIDDPECMVAAIFNSLDQVLVMCRPGDKTWSVFDQVIDEDDLFFQLLFSRTGKLYALILNANKDGLIKPSTIKLGDHEVEMILAYDIIINEAELNFEYHNNYKICLSGTYSSFLVESTNKEVLVIHQASDILTFRRREPDRELEGINPDGDIHHEHQDENDHNEEDQNMPEENDHDEGQADDDDDDDTEYIRTTSFNVYRIDLETGQFPKVENLGDQTILLGLYDSFCLPTTEFKELQRNSIYFAREADCGDLIATHKFTSREIGICNLDNGRIVRPFPSVEISKRSRTCWFTPKLG